MDKYFGNTDKLSNQFNNSPKKRRIERKKVWISELRVCLYLFCKIANNFRILIRSIKFRN